MVSPDPKVKEFQKALAIKSQHERAVNLRPWLALNVLLACVFGLDVSDGCHFAKQLGFEHGPLLEQTILGCILLNIVTLVLRICWPYMGFTSLYLNEIQLRLLGAHQKLPNVELKQPVIKSPVETVSPLKSVRFWWMPAWWNRIDWIFQLKANQPVGRGSFYLPQGDRTGPIVGSPYRSFDSNLSSLGNVPQSNFSRLSVTQPQATSTDLFASGSSLGQQSSMSSPAPSRSVSSYLGSFSPSCDIGIGLSPVHSTPASQMGAYSPGSSTPTWSLSERQIPQMSPYSTPTGSNISAELSGLMALQDRGGQLWRDNIVGPQPCASASYLSPKPFTLTAISPPAAQSSPYERQNQNWMRLRRAKSESPFLSPGANCISDYSVDSNEQLLNYLTEYERRRALSRSVAPTWKSSTVQDSYLGGPERQLSTPVEVNDQSNFGFSTSASGNLRPLLQSPPSFSLKAPSKYQISTGLAPPTPTHKRSGSGGSAKSLGKSGDESFISLGNASSNNLSLSFWSQFDIDPIKLECFVQNLRLWVSRTILKPIVAEIDVINRKLTAQGRTDLLIGEATVVHLQSLALSSMGTQFPNLSSLLTYLDITPHQSYLVGRLRELAADGCMCDFHYKGGGQFKGRKWEEHLPTDTQVVLHLICVYLDSKCPPNPLYPDGRTFSGQFVVVPPAKRSELSKGPLVEQTTVNPPHFRFVADGEAFDPGPGRNNFFQVLVMLFRHFEVKQNGQLACVSLDTDGLNIAWIFDE